MLKNVIFDKLKFNFDCLKVKYNKVFAIKMNFVDFENYVQNLLRRTFFLSTFLMIQKRIYRFSDTLNSNITFSRFGFSIFYEFLSQNLLKN